MISINSEYIGIIKQAALDGYPEEVCGLLVGSKWRNGEVIVSNIAPSLNISEFDRTRNFEIDPSLRFKVERDLRGKNEYIIGHYHSHPNGDAKPSEYDLASANEPSLLWLIVSLSEQSINQLSVWRLSPDKKNFSIIPLSIIN